MSFTDAYKAWRNRARKYNLESIVSGAINVLGELVVRSGRRT